MLLKLLHRAIPSFPSSWQQLRQRSDLLNELLRRITPTAALAVSHYPDFLDNIPIGLYRTRPDGTILEANQQLVELLGFANKAELIATNAAACYYDPADRGRMTELLTRNRLVKNFETRFRRKDGAVIWVRDNCRAVVDPDGQVICFEGSVEDITRQKEAEQALRESEERYRNLIERQGDGLAIVDNKETITFCNKVAEEIFGVPPHTLVGRNLKDFATPDSFAAIRRETKKRQRGERSTYEVEIIRGDGKKSFLLVTATPWKENENAPLASFAIFHDNTEHKCAEQNLRHSEEKYRAVVAQSAECIFLLELETKKLLEANSALRRLLGYTAQEMSQLSVYDFVAHSTQNIEQQIQTVASDKNHFLGERRYRRKDGSIVAVEVNASLIYYGGKKVLCVVSRDISERKQAEEALQLSERRLRQSQKLDAVGRLAGGVAHDFNNLMGGILGCVELLLGRTDAQSPLRKHIEEIRSSAERAAALTQQLLSFSRRKSIRSEALRVDDAIIEMKSLLSRLVHKNIHIAFDLQPDLWAIRGDRSQFEQILLNLVLNANDAMTGSGTITVRTENTTFTESDVVHNPNARIGDFVTLRVEDEGEGMSKVLIGRIFEPFFTTKEPGKGTGLGLSTVYGIVKQHQGWIEVESTPNQGTEFSVYLPARSSQTRKSAPPTARVRSGAGKVVLVVEKDETLRKKVKTALEAEDFVVFSAADAAAALAIVEKRQNKLDLVFSNLSLPDQSGIRLADEIRTHCADLPILVTGTFSHDAANLTTIPKKGYDYLQKPYETGDLLDAIYENL
jgi:PAS domain S-box-containing protein